MKKLFDATFRPLGPDDAQHQPLPGPIQAQAEAAERTMGNLARAAEYEALRTPKRGRPRKEPSGGLRAALSAESPQELEALMAAHVTAVGKKEQGNKRIGASALYAELVQQFALLAREGITLPRNKSLSAAACSFGLGEILRRHGKISTSDEQLLKKGNARQAVADKLDRVFSRVADAVENTPAIIWERSPDE